jgi:mono/diheme cytochrome c family protein
LARDGETGLRVGRKSAIGAAIALGVIALAVWRIEAASAVILARVYPAPRHTLAATPNPAMAAEGERLARVDGCFSCHGAALTGKVAFHGWFGTRITAPNLTTFVPHASNAELDAAIRYGLSAHRTSLIEMPSIMMIRSSDSDVAAIIAYLRTLKPKPDSAAATRWNFGGKAMLAMHLLPIEAERVDRKTRGPVQTPTEIMARGHYLTEAHCAACHGGNLTGEAIVSSPSLRFSIVHYSPAAFLHFFRTGQGRIGHGTKIMTKMIRTRFHELTSADVQAIFTYLQTSKGQ